MTEYEAVFWDIGGVLVELQSVREGYATFVAELAERHDLAVEEPLETWTDVLGEHFRSREGTEYRTAAEGYRKATRALFDDLLPESEWRPLFDTATTATLRSEPGAVETVQALDDAGVYQGVVSDIDTREAESMLTEFSIRECFDHLTTSEAVGYTKPDRRMFETALEKTSVPAEAGVMVGDRYDHDVAGASAVGLDGVAYGEDAAGPEADHEVDDLRAVLDVVGVR